MGFRLLVNEQDRQLVQNALHEFYSKRPNQHAERIEQAIYDRYAQTVVQYTSPGARVLDVGSGIWRSPHTLSQLGLEVDRSDSNCC
jgi:hypothetical protein